jgi:hypothetical protein
MTSRGNGYDLSCFFDCLHDMGRPVEQPGTPQGSVRRAAQAPFNLIIEARR